MIRNNDGLALSPIPFKQILADMEKSLINQAMLNNDRNQSAAARQLGISRSTLIHKVNQYEAELKRTIGLK